ncbi:uncharacterized protein KD926_006442 [Aspergillus affinis]|uniref:uncharacterized protein n=1 Tax=Aspergillus affinis TaxID=1070780 RepID=UPI0022FE3840|nr:uncharacterized protein KD926_006442 [Aspergillus affinis]KAI9041896.1 hypothetical protein KD926_006442 [Aspergillus affinis]
MATADTPNQDTDVHTLSEQDENPPHVILTGSCDQPEYVRLLEERLLQLENKIENLMAGKTNPSEAEENKSEHGSPSSNRGDSDESEEKKAEEEEKNPGTIDEEKQDDEEKKEVERSIIAKAHKLNLINFTNRFPNQTEIPVVEALMVDTTVSAAYEEDSVFTQKLSNSSAPDALKAMQAKTETNPFKPDAWMARLRVNSVPLVKEIMNILSPEQEFSTSLTFCYPFPPLVQHHDQIKARFEKIQADSVIEKEETEAGSDEEIKQLVSEFQTYIGFMESEVIPHDPSTHNKVRYPALSAIFKLGDSIYVPGAGKSSKPNPEMLGQRDDQRLWRLYRTEEDVDQDKGNFKIKCYAMDHDGESYVCIRTTFRIPAFVGEQEISSLPVFPLRYAENAEQIQKECRKQGETFLDYLETKLLTHNGWALDPDPDESHSPLQYVTSDVVVDMAEALKAHPNWKPHWKFPKVKPRERSLNTYSIFSWTATEKDNATHDTVEENFWQHEYARMQKTEYCTKADPFLSSWNNEQGKTYNPREGDLELLPRRLFSYVLQDRRFVAVDIRSLNHVDDHWTRSASLIIDKDHEDMLRALVNSHFKRKDLHDSLGVYGINQDIISNKGRGLIILLYGVPGVGKTSTAENIAHLWKKPLLPITCGDLGTLPSDVEKNLKDIFRLAQLWGCILLLDEADVFLSERTPAALERNALVSVFLRMLEYYTGILFLTTNLPGSIDEAFKSRIHISLYYPHLSKETTLKIWDMNLMRLAGIEAERAKAKQQPPLTIDVKGIKRFAKRHYRFNEDGKGRWNGRQIRNAFLIASALAHFEKDNPTASRIVADDASADAIFDIKPKHFEVVADASMGFERYLLETRGRTAGENAYQRGLRADHIRSSPEKLGEMPYMPHQSSQKHSDNVYGDPFPSGTKKSRASSGLYRGDHDHDQRRHLNETQYDESYGYQGMFSSDQQFGVQHQAQRTRTSVSRGTALPPMNLSPQDSPSPFSTSKQASHKGHSSRFPAVNEDSETDDDSDQ